MNQHLEEVLKQEEESTLAFKPTAAMVFTSFVVEPHYNLVIMCAPPLSSLLSDSITPLSNSLALTDPENYHVTVCTFPANTDPMVIENVKTICASRGPLTLQIAGLHLQPKGVVANAYSLDGALAALRSEIAKEVGDCFRVTSRWPDVSWVTLGRYTNKPLLPVCQYVRDRVKQGFGAFTNKPVLFKSDSRQRLGAVAWQDNQTE